MDKSTFILILTIWNLVSSYVVSSLHLQLGDILLIAGIGSAFIAWLRDETGFTDVPITQPQPTPQPTPQSQTQT
jgi:hypothetical protein